MRVFLLSQFFVHVFLVSPPSVALRGVIAAFWVGLIGKQPVWGLLGAVWQLYALTHFEGLVAESIWFLRPEQLRCDGYFWFVCSSSRSNFILNYLQGTVMGSLAAWVRNWVELRCLAWPPFWGNFALNLVLGGEPEDSLKSLYRNLGFLHVLVISGSQFTLLCKCLKSVCLRPIALFYALGLWDWRLFRNWCFLAEWMSSLGLCIYLLACGASPPCQRACLEQLWCFYQKWGAPPPHPPKSGGWRIFLAQTLLFPQDCFSLSNLLSWGAVTALRSGEKSLSLFSQLRISIIIQILSLAIFARLSLASLLFDFLVSPVWEILLFICLAGIFVPELHAQFFLTSALDFFHAGLWAVDRWQGEVFGSSALSFRALWRWTGRLVAAGLFLGLISSHWNPAVSSDKATRDS